MSETVNIAGGGLAGCEAAQLLANSGIKVNIYEARPLVKTGAHRTDCLAELVCSNSFKSTELTNAHGLLKSEMKALGSLVIDCAEKTSVPGGKALTVDRNSFSRLVHETVEKNVNIKIIREEVTTPSEGFWIIATGPLSSENICSWIKNVTGHDFLYFTDAMSPIVELEHIDLDICYMAGRYGFGDDYLNCPFDIETYEKFLRELAQAQRAESHHDENVFFQGCMPVEEIAAGGYDTLRFGLMKPRGLKDPHTGGEPFAVCQLRRENKEMKRWNIVGFQTRLKYSEQKKVFSSIPGLNDAKFIRYGQAHRNTYINSPKILEKDTMFIKNMKAAVAGQLSGVEGYAESAASGMLAALCVLAKMKNIQFAAPPVNTLMGGLFRHVHEEKNDFQPSAANYSLVEAPEMRFKNKKEKQSYMSSRSMEAIIQWRNGFLREILL